MAERSDKGSSDLSNNELEVSIRGREISVNSRSLSDFESKLMMIYFYRMKVPRILQSWKIEYKTANYGLHFLRSHPKLDLDCKTDNNYKMILLDISISIFIKKSYIMYPTQSSNFHINLILNYEDLSLGISSVFDIENVSRNRGRYYSE